MTETEKPLRPMLPVRHAPNLFSLDIGSISLKDIQQQMEFPFFSLAKNPDLEPRRYEDRHGNSLEITPSVKGLPTIYDKDILIYAISQVMERLNRGERASRRLILYASDMLEFANRNKSGRDYMALDDALTRLRGCTIKTNIRTGDIYQTDVFGLIERGGLIRKYGFDGRLQHVEITLSEWLWNAIVARQVLTLHPDYFRLRQPLERRIYEIARKHCGRQAEWQISLVLLQQKCGSRSKLFEFRRSVRKLAAKGGLLDYDADYNAERDAVVFRRQEGSLVDRIPAANGDGGIELPESVAAEARRRHGGGIDLAAAERDWRGWMARKGVRPTNPPALFLSFLATWAGRRRDDPPEARGEADWVQEMAIEWWGSLGGGEREAWRDLVGDRVELSDGEGWFRSEASIAREAFDRRWLRQRRPAAESELPPQLLARAAAEAGAAPEEVERFWREWIPAKPYLHDRPLSSVILCARELAGRR
ncbi:MAG: replication initiator protein A [Albidovulum sp.]|nr:replication initiator protein A [Albidovulum sp.]